MTTTSGCASRAGYPAKGAPTPPDPRDARIKALEDTISMALGNILNAQIYLETGVTKAVAAQKLRDLRVKIEAALNKEVK